MAISKTVNESLYFWAHKIELCGMAPTDTGVDGQIRIDGGYCRAGEWSAPVERVSEVTTVQAFADAVGAHLGKSGEDVVQAIKGALEAIVAQEE